MARIFDLTYRALRTLSQIERKEETLPIFSPLKFYESKDSSCLDRNGKQKLASLSDVNKPREGRERDRGSERDKKKKSKKEK